MIEDLGKELTGFGKGKKFAYTCKNELWEYDV